MNKKIMIVFFTLSLSLSAPCAVLIEGDKNAPTGQTFSFTINKNILSPNGTFYAGASEVILDNEFSLSRLVRTTNAFAPLTPAIVNFNTNPNSENPLFGAKIIALGILQKEVGFFMEDMPVVVAENRPATVYLFEDILPTGNINLISSQDVHDAANNVSSGIVNLTTDIVGHVFAAAKPNGGEFGDIDSAISLLIRGIMETPGETLKTRVFGEIQFLRLDPTSDALAINNALSQIVNNQIVMHWDTALERLFVGLQTTSGNNSNDGTRAVAVIKFLENGSITLETIAPDTVFSAGDTSNIIGIRGANQRVSIHALNTMWTSTALNYLIVVGNVGNSASTQQSVFALPLVNAGDSKGMIAPKSAEPQNIFKNESVPRLIARTISEPATTAAEMTHSTDTAAQVGGGNLLAGPIINIIVRGDTVFALVGENTPGIYSSQAIFDATGKITSWTQWQRAAGTTDTIFAAALNPFEGNFILASGTTADTINTITRTVWSSGSADGLQPLTTILDATFANNKGGIQGMQTFLPNSSGLQNISVLAAGGVGTILLTQTGTINTNGTSIPTQGANFNDIMEFTNGTISTNVNAKTVIISGGELNNLGPITAFEFAQNPTNGWLFVGGSNGLAVLAQEDGSGWNSSTQLGNDFNGLINGMRFIRLGNYSFVKKLIADDNFLFVISRDKIDRINLTNSDFGTNTLDVTTIASIGNNGVSNRGGFLDGIFSQALGIIATTDGLLRIGDNKDVRTITNSVDANWTAIAIPESAGAPTALYTVTHTNRLQDITRYNGGYFYVLTANAGLDQSRINRFAIQPLGLTEAVSSATIQPFNDLFVKNIPSFLLSYGEFRSNFATDGALYFATRNKNDIIAPTVTLTPAQPTPRVGFGNVGDRSNTITVTMGQATKINYFARSKASGSWIAAGDFDTQVLE